MKRYPFSIQKALSLEYDTENRIISNELSFEMSKMSRKIIR